MSFVPRAQRTCVVTYLASLALQFYAAGLAVFGVTTFDPHALLGYGLIVGSLCLAALSAAARLPKSVVRQALVLVPLSVLQPVLALVPRVDAPALSAMHTVNALAIVLIAASVARASRPAEVGRAT